MSVTFVLAAWLCTRFADRAANDRGFSQREVATIFYFGLSLFCIGIGLAVAEAIRA